MWVSELETVFLFICCAAVFLIGGSRESVTTCCMLDRVERSRVISETQHSGQMKQVFHTQWKLLRMKTGNGGNDSVSLYGIWIYTMYIKFKVLLKFFYLLCYCLCLFAQIVNMYMNIHMWNYHIATHFFSPVFIKLSTAFYAACEPLYFHMAAAEHNAWCWTWCSTGEFYQLHHCVGTAVQTGPRLYL